MELDDTQDRYTPDIGTAEAGRPINCGVCKEEMSCRHNVNGPRGFVQAMCGSSSLHDVFECPNIEELWHKQVKALREWVHSIPSASVGNLVEKEIEVILTTRQPTKG